MIRYEKELKDIRKEIERRQGYDFLKGKTLARCLGYRYYSGCSPEKSNEIGLQKCWIKEFKRNANNARFWNSLLIVLGHELTHFELYESGVYGIKDFEKSKEQELFSWVKEIYCDIKGTQRVGKTSDDLVYRLKKYSKYVFGGKGYPSKRYRIKISSKGRFDRNTVREIAEKIYNSMIPEELIDKIYIFFDDVILE